MAKLADKLHLQKKKINYRARSFCSLIKILHHGKNKTKVTYKIPSLTIKQIFQLAEKTQPTIEFRSTNKQNKNCFHELCFHFNNRL